LYERHPNTNCIVCDRAIYRKPSQIKRNNNRVFCSILCYGTANRKEKPCAICGKMILSGLNKKTCSRSCANIQRAGIKYTGARPRDKVKYQRGLKIRLAAERGQKCERCNYSKYEILQVHHKDRNRDNNSLENLQLICPNCHYEEHYFGKSWLRNHVEK
jgi:hypothetical protein